MSVFSVCVCGRLVTTLLCGFFIDTIMNPNTEFLKKLISSLSKLNSEGT